MGPICNCQAHSAESKNRHTMLFDVKPWFQIYPTIIKPNFSAKSLQSTSKSNTSKFSRLQSNEQ
eukprot:scaffold179039_cov12-Tisochrysis_lutea.AAC.1